MPERTFPGQRCLPARSHKMQNKIYNILGGGTKGNIPVKGKKYIGKLHLSNSSYT
jgi:hypothetical protein